MSNKRIIIIWSILDFCSIGWYVVWKIAHWQVPFYTDMIISINNAQSFGHPMPIVISSLSLLMYPTLIISGYLLYMQKPVASKIVYLQTPLRLITLIPPSVFFITWPVKHLFDNAKAITAIMAFVILILLSESLKTCSVFFWRKKIAIT